MTNTTSNRRTDTLNSMIDDSNDSDDGDHDHDADNGIETMDHLQAHVDNQKVSRNLLNAAAARAERLGQPPASESQIINRCLWLYLALGNPEEMLSETREGPES